MARVFMNGCEAIVAAVRAGCRFFAGYPITPQNEIPEYFARTMSELDRIFVQGESEVESVNMVYGAARIPMVYANISRGGPGVGSIQQAQIDYFQPTSIMLGVYVGYTEVLFTEVVWNTIEHKLAKKPKLLELNKEAFEKGLKIGIGQKN